MPTATYIKTPSIACPGPGKAELCFTGEDGLRGPAGPLCSFEGPGIIQGQHNTDRSIASFARSCFNYALSVKQDLWFSTKDTISKIYDHRFKDIFAELYETDFKAAFEAAGIEYFYTLIDDAVARVIRSRGGFIWALKKLRRRRDERHDRHGLRQPGHDDQRARLPPAGSSSMRPRTAPSPATTTATSKGEETSTNPVATIFAWTGALRKRGELDGLADLQAFADRLEKSTLATIEGGRMTKDLVALYEGEATGLNSDAFLDAIAQTLEKPVIQPVKARGMRMPCALFVQNWSIMRFSLEKERPLFFALMRCYTEAG